MRTIITACLALLLVLTLAWPAQAARVGSSAPDFDLMTLNGHKVNLESYSGQGPLLIFFWTTWCHFCESEIHAIQDLKDEYAANGLQFLGINPGWRDSEQRARSYRRRQGVDLTMAFDRSSRLGSRYMVQGVPTLFLVDNEGVIQYRGHGITQDLRSILDRLLTEG